MHCATVALYIRHNQNSELCTISNSDCSAHVSVQDRVFSTATSCIIIIEALWIWQEPDLTAAVANLGLQTYGFGSSSSDVHPC